MSPYFKSVIFIVLVFANVAKANLQDEQALTEAVPSELVAQFETLTDKEQASFLEKRRFILSSMEIGFRKTKWAFYLADVFKTTAVSIKNLILYDSENDPPSSEIAEMIRIDRNVNPQRYENKKILYKVDEKIKSVLHATDLKLWSQSALVANSNQFSLMAAVEIQAEGGTKSHKWGGLYDLGFTIGYNTDSKAVVFQIFRNRETFKSSMMPAVAVGGFVAKIGPLISRANGETSMRTNGESFYPPMVPGYQSTTKESYTFGFSSGLTVPPSPFGDMLTYTNTLDQKTILRISFSKAYIGFVRVKMDLSSDTLKFVQEKFTDLFKTRMSCIDIF
jgi:hypothetical protein